MRRSPLLIVAAAMIILSACQSDAEPSAKKPRGEPTGIALSDLPESLSTLTPYPSSKKPELEAPEGFEPVFAENVARHGARSLTSDDPLEDAIELWDQAKAANALTTVGKKFGPDVRALHNAMTKVGYGDLSTLGQEEMQGIGAREGERLSQLFDSAVADGAKIDVFDSGKGRAEQSAENFSVGLGSVKPDLDIEPPESDEKILKFSNENNKYEDFLDDGPWKDDYNAARRLAKIDAISIEVLERLYKPDFVAGIEDPLEEAAGVYDVYRSAPAMSRDINVDSRQYVTKEAANAFAYVDDARYFYSRGPGIVGDDGSYQAAQILLDDFFSAIDDHLLERGSHPHAAVYRFAHAEEITPFAAMLELPDADEQAKPGDIYTHENNDFRVSTVSPLSANIEWIVWSKGDTNIVSIQHNEVPTTVGRDCKPYKDTENFYKLEELRTCLGATPDTPAIP